MRKSTSKTNDNNDNHNATKKSTISKGLHKFIKSFKSHKQDSTVEIEINTGKEYEKEQEEDQDPNPEVESIYSSHTSIYLEPQAMASSGQLAAEYIQLIGDHPNARGYIDPVEFAISAPPFL